MRILILGGCGAIGTEVVNDLARASNFTSIVIADINLQKAEELAEASREKDIRTIRLDVNEKSTLVKLMKQVDVVANCTTYHYGVVALESAIEAGVNYLDLGGLYNTPRQLRLNDQAVKARMTAVLGCGATPGITNVLVRYAANELEKVEQIHIAFASFRNIAPSPGMLDTVLDEFSPNTERFYYDRGELIKVAPFSGAREIEFESPIGIQTTYYVPHSEIHTLPRFIKGVNVVDVRGTWRPDIMAALKSFSRFGLLQDNEVKIKGARIGSKEFLKAHLLQINSDEDGEWGFYLNVEVEGWKNKEKVSITYNVSHPSRTEWGTAVTAKITGISASIGTQLLATGRTPVKGVIAPEACFDPPHFVSELARRGIKVVRK